MDLPLSASTFPSDRTQGLSAMDQGVPLYRVLYMARRLAALTSQLYLKSVPSRAMDRPMSVLWGWEQIGVAQVNACRRPRLDLPKLSLPLLYPEFLRYRWPTEEGKKKAHRSPAITFKNNEARKAKP